MTKMSIKQAAIEDSLQEFTKSEYGRYSYIEETEVKNEDIVASIGFKIPRSFYDDLESNVYYKHLDLKSIATIRTKKTPDAEVRAPSQDEISERIEDRIQSLQSQVEQRLISMVASELAEIPGVQQDFSKVRKLVRILKRQTETDLSSFRKSEDKAERYIDLLKSLDYISENNGRFSESNKLKDLFDRKGNNAHQEIIEEILSKKMNHVKDFELSNVQPYTRLLNCYYFESYSAGTLLQLEDSHITELHNEKFDRNDPQYKIEDWLDTLVSKGLIRRRKGCYVGQNEIFEHLTTPA